MIFPTLSFALLRTLRRASCAYDSQLKICNKRRAATRRLLGATLNSKLHFRLASRSPPRQASRSAGLRVRLLRSSAALAVSFAKRPSAAEEAENGGGEEERTGAEQCTSGEEVRLAPLHFLQCVFVFVSVSLYLCMQMHRKFAEKEQELMSRRGKEMSRQLSSVKCVLKPNLYLLEA